MKRVIVIHGWQGKPGNHWKGWLKKELETRGFEVVEPIMPNNSNEPKDWVNVLNKAIGIPDEETCLVGHSLGCPTAVAYLAGLQNNEKITGCILVAGFSSRIGYDELNKFDFTDDFVKKSKNHCKKFFSVVSDNDTDVPKEKSIELNDLVGGELILENKKGHFCEEDGVTKLPSVLDSILKIFY